MTEDLFYFKAGKGMILHNSEFSNRTCSPFSCHNGKWVKNDICFQKELFILFLKTECAVSVNVKSVSALCYEIQNSRCHLRLRHCDVISGRPLCLKIDNVVPLNFVLDISVISDCTDIVCSVYSLSLIFFIYE